MDIAVLGTGVVGQALAGRLPELGHRVTVGTRDPGATLARTEPGAMGALAFADFAAAHPDVGVATYAEAAAGAELVVNATSGRASLDALGQVGADDLAGVVVLDVANPLDFSTGFPPTLLVKDTDSLGEQLQRAFPAARVVTSLNTVDAAVMVHPEMLSEPGSVFVCGDDASAKAFVTGLLGELGHPDVIDLGGIQAARGVEMLLPLSMYLATALGSFQTGIRVVR